MTRRLYTAGDVRSFARCPELWWFERRRSDLARLDAAELQRRRDELQQEYGAAAAGLPEDRLLAQLLARRQHVARGKAYHQAHATRALRARGGCLLPLMLAMALPCLAALLLRSLDDAGPIIGTERSTR